MARPAAQGHEGQGRKYEVPCFSRGTVATTLGNKKTRNQEVRGVFGVGGHCPEADGESSPNYVPRRLEIRRLSSFALFCLLVKMHPSRLLLQQKAKTGKGNEKLPCFCSTTFNEAVLIARKKSAV